MSSLKRINKDLQKHFGGKVTATIKDDIVILQGSLDNWNDIVKAGYMSVDKRRRWNVVNDIEYKGGNIPPMKIPPLRDIALDGKKCDVMIVGAGIVGCAIARELSRYELDILLVDKEHDVALHASSRNDGVVHPGIDLKRGTLKKLYNDRGNKMYDEVCSELGVEFKRIGQYIGITEKWLKYLLKMAPIYWRIKGVPCSYLSKKELLKREPNLNREVVAALSFPTAGIVCPYGLTIAYAENAVQNGVELSLDTAVLDMHVKNNNIISVDTNRGRVYPTVVVNAAGVFSEDIAKMANDRFFSIHPRKGTNAILDKKAAFQVRTIASFIGTIATKSTHSKGGAIVSTIDNNLLVGPDAIETQEKENFATDKQSIDRTFVKQKTVSPLLSTGDIITYFTGVRAPTYEEDFVISKGHNTNNIVHAAGIQSPGLTAAPAIAVDVAKMAVAILEKINTVRKNVYFNPNRQSILRTAELTEEQRNKLIKCNPDYGVIICRCEEVSRGEIVDAVNRSVPCDTLDGVKRRVRPGMGRCQGGFCGPLIAQIIAEEKGITLDKVLKSGSNSCIVYGSTKGGEDNA